MGNMLINILDSMEYFDVYSQINGKYSKSKNVTFMKTSCFVKDQMFTYSEIWVSVLGFSVCVFLM